MGYRDILKLARQFDFAPNVSAGSSLQYQSRATTLGIHIRNEANRRFREPVTDTENFSLLKRLQFADAEKAALQRLYSDAIYAKVPSPSVWCLPLHLLQLCLQP